MTLNYTTTKTSCTVWHNLNFTLSLQKKDTLNFVTLYREYINVFKHLNIYNYLGILFRLTIKNNFWTECVFNPVHILIDHLVSS
jgi:hypothetical protein